MCVCVCVCVFAEGDGGGRGGGGGLGGLDKSRCKSVNIGSLVATLPDAWLIVFAHECVCN